MSALQLAQTFTAEKSQMRTLRVPDIFSWVFEVIFHLVEGLAEERALGAFQKSSNQRLSKALRTVSR
jgi:hypothetical protein